MRCFFHILFNHSSVDRHLDRFCLFSILIMLLWTLRTDFFPLWNFCLGLGPQSKLHRTYSWPCPQVSLLDSLGDIYEVLESNPNQLHARQTSYMLYNFCSLDFTPFKMILLYFSALWPKHFSIYESFGLFSLENNS